MIDALAKILGVVFNFIFDLVYKVTPVGSLGITIILFTILVRLLMIPLVAKQQSSLKRMQEIQPELQKIQDKYKNKQDPESQRQMSIELNEFYRKHNVSPFSGCLLLFIQMPIFIALWRVLQKAGTYISKLHDLYYNLASQIVSTDGYQEIVKNILSGNKRIKLNDEILASAEGLQSILSQVSTSEWNKLSETLGTISNTLIEQKNSIEYFFGISLVDSPADLIKQGLNTPALIVVILFPIMAALTTFLSSKLLSMNNKNNKQKQNDQTEQIQKSMNLVFPVITGMMTYSLPAGLGIYWITSNIIQIIQQYVINKSMDKSGEGE